MHHYHLHRDPRSSHQQIIGHVLRLRRQPVLDVGAAQGILGQLLQGSGLTIDAVEMHPQWAEDARPFYRRVFNHTIEDAPLPERTYEMVLCGDVLEHTVDPVAVLRRLARSATADATFVVSLPNVAHLAVRLMLLFGRFPRMEKGILDKTHLHFFTRATAEATLREAGLRVESASVTGVPLEELWRGGEGLLLFRAARKMQHAALALMPRLFGYQWIFVARPAAPAAVPLAADANPAAPVPQSSATAAA
jgi:2-polyprenyl-3-methyl-5-hydroxy-6-metoxy-1,4-benzoquinol methylase